MQFISI